MTIATPPFSSSRPGPLGREHIVLEGISWGTYRSLRTECDRLHLKMTFDRGTLEIMPPLPDHAVITRFIDQVIGITCDLLRIPLVGYRDTTWQREALSRGLEADDCYYIRHAALADQRGTDIDLDRDPPPDLAVETDITRSSVDKESVYAKLGVPELWRWDHGRLHVRVLGAEGRYADVERSVALPMLPPNVVEQFVLQRLRDGEWRAKEAFRAWATEHLRGGEPGEQSP